MDKKNDPYHSIKASACLLFLCILSLQALSAGTTDAKPASGITITEADASPAIAAIGEDVRFTASYQTIIEDGTYSIRVCKSKKLDADGFCRDGIWCQSAQASANVPLECTYATTAEDLGNASYAIFICETQGECSNAVSGTFSVRQKTLSLQAPEQIAFQPAAFSLESQNSKDNELGDLFVTGVSSNHAGWSVDLSAEDWQDENGQMMDYDGDGAATGQLTVNLDAATIESEEAISGLTLSDTASFSDAAKTINLVTAAKKSGNGTFIIKNIRFDQFVPGNQQEGNYKTILIFTIS